MAFEVCAGHYSIEDEDHARRPSELDLESLRNQVEADPYQTSRDMATALGVSQTTVVRDLKSIDKVLKLGR